MSGLSLIGTLSQGGKQKLSYTYSGSSTKSNVTYGGETYLQLVLTTSGTLSIQGEAEAQIWLCGGGASGGYDSTTGTSVRGGKGGSGGVTASATKALVPGTYSITIGAGGSTRTSSGQNAGTGSSCASLVSASGGTGTSGGSGGGGGSSVGTGQGTSTGTRPFGDTTNFSSRAHSPGGGGGGCSYNDEELGNTIFWRGGNGGSNGSNGSAAASVSSNASALGGSGGAYGGGNGGSYSSRNGSAASYYGGGGGGNGVDIWYGASSGISRGNGGAGYQGVVYIRIKLSEVAV